MIDLKSMTDEQLVHAEFMRRFSSWDIEVDKLEDKLQRLDANVRQTHYSDVASIVSKDAWKREIDDWKRRVAKTLAMGIQNGVELTEMQRQGLRILMLEIDNFDETLRRRATYVQTQPLRPMHQRL